MTFLTSAWLVPEIEDFALVCGVVRSVASLPWHLAQDRVLKPHAGPLDCVATSRILRQAFTAESGQGPDLEAPKLYTLIPRKSQPVDCQVDGARDAGAEHSQSRSGQPDMGKRKA